LAIEIDGDSHDNKRYTDNERDLYFEQRGIKTVRVENREVFNRDINKKIEIIIKKREEELKF